ncbi:hypothetical protein LZ30DRAFT_692137 [Colletotrichum cereale]|nr:hypothetical protein LZ30DRAFT_692137 [Colletotrichum cereale]
MSLEGVVRPLLTDLESRLYEPATDAGAARTLRLILDLATRAGLRTFCTSNIVAPYVASRHKTASREEDTIYAMQKIFGFRLGSSAIGFSGCSFTLSQLEAQFATKLLTVYPHESQMFLHSKPAPVGTAWLPNDDSRVPTGIPGYMRTSHIFTGTSDREKGAQPHCALGIADLNGVTWVTFTGPTSFWPNFQTKFLRTDKEQNPKETER